jgi:hypothetical protein
VQYEEAAMPNPHEPRPLLDALRSGAPLPDFAPEAVEQARTLAKDAAAATAAAVEALPAPLAEAILEGAVIAGSTTLPEALSRSSVKPLAKAAKKALYRLRSKGVAAPRARACARARAGGLVLPHHRRHHGGEARPDHRPAPAWRRHRDGPGGLLG